MSLFNFKIKSLILLSILVLGIVTVSSINAVPLPDWTIVITATATPYASRCTLGVSGNALNTFDPNYDSLAAPDPPTGLNSWFYYPSLSYFSSKPAKTIHKHNTIKLFVGISGKDNRNFRNRSYILE